MVRSGDNEWVILLTGSASLLLEGDREPVLMKPGDYLNIPAINDTKYSGPTRDEKTFGLPYTTNSTIVEKICL
jgi:hypothetical protein